MKDIFKKCKINDDTVKNYGMAVEHVAGDYVLVKEKPKVKSTRVYSAKYYVAYIKHDIFVRTTAKLDSFQKAYQILKSH